MTNEQFEKAKVLTRHNKMLCILLKRNGNCPETSNSLVGLCNENENFKKEFDALVEKYMIDTKKQFENL